MASEKCGSYVFKNLTKIKEGVIILIPNQKVLIKFHSRNKERLESLGYKYTGMGTEIYIDIKDLSRGSKAFVSVQCDYCGKIYTKRYKDYWNQRTNGKDCCIDCVAKKRGETNVDKYGGVAPSCSIEVCNKQQNTCLVRYGVKFPAQLEFVKDKMKQTNLLKYGVECASKSEIVKNKTKETCQLRYGGYSSQCDAEIRKKSLLTRMSNNNFPVSIPEKEMINLLKQLYGEENCQPQYILDRISFDCLLTVDNIKIDVEFDGKYWHNNSHKDMRRDYFTISKGYKVLRFKGNYNPPTQQQIIEGVSYLVNSEHHVKIIDLDT